jgi:hypothetical protein
LRHPPQTRNISEPTEEFQTVGETDSSSCGLSNSVPEDPSNEKLRILAMKKSK